MSVQFEDNSEKVLSALDRATPKILEKWGIKLEGWAKKLCPVGTVESTGIKGYVGGTLRNSITHIVSVIKKTVTIGTNIIYGPYVELGTGPWFEAPPDWEAFDVPRPSGIGRGYVHPRPFLQPAVTDHVDDLQRIMKDELKNAN